VRLRSFQSRALLVFLVSLTAVQLMTFSVVYFLNTRTARTNMQDTLTRGAETLENLMKGRVRRLAEAATLLASDFGFKAAYATNDRATILSALENHQTRVVVDGIALISMDGTVVTHTFPAPGHRLYASLTSALRAAEEHGEAAAAVAIDDRAFQVAIVPLHAPIPVAWVVIGFAIDDRLALDFQRAVHADVSFLWPSSPGRPRGVASTLALSARDMLRKRLADPAAAWPTTGSVSLGDDEYLTLVRSMGGGDTVVAVLQTSVARALRPFYQLRTTLVILCGTGLIVSLAIGVLAGRNVTRPVRTLVESVRRIGKGEYAQPVAIGHGDEFAELGVAINDMAASLETHRATLQRKIAEAQTLYEIGREISAQVAVAEPSLQRVVEGARQLLHGDLAMLWLPDGDSEEFVVKACSGTVSGRLERVRFRPGGELPDFVGRSIVVASLKARESVTGLLAVTSEQSGAFDEDDRQLLGALADQAAIAIENVRLYQQAVLQAEELEVRVRQRTNQLEQVNAKLEIASRHKSEFLASMSHELRTPLNAIIGFTRVVMRRSKEVLPERQYNNLGNVLVSAEHLLALIDNVLDLSKIEAGQLQVYAERVDLDALIDDCLSATEPLVDQARVQLVKAGDDDLPSLFTDQRKLRQIIINLLSNSVKFTDMGSIRVTTWSREGRVKIEVADTGIGIPRDALELIFDKFGQVPSERSRQRGGTGLGLSISRQLARLLGGDITVESTVGVGATFTVVLPITHADAVRATSDAEASS
jgi:signal transduction histidine kinase